MEVVYFLSDKLISLLVAYSIYKQLKCETRLGWLSMKIYELTKRRAEFVEFLTEKCGPYLQALLNDKTIEQANTYVYYYYYYYCFFFF